MGIPTNHPAIAQAARRGLFTPTFRTEAQFQVAVERVATECGWMHYHTHDSRRSTPGFPDLVLVRGSRIVFLELKTENGRLTDDQQAWRKALGAVGGSVEYHLFRPSDWREVMEVLR